MPTTVRRCMVCARPCRRWRWLWGNNLTGAVSFLLEFLLQPLAHPVAAFGQYLVFDLAQRAGAWMLCVHGPPIKRFRFRMGGEPFTIPLWW